MKKAAKVLEGLMIFLHSEHRLVEQNHQYELLKNHQLLKKEKKL